MTFDRFGKCPICHKPFKSDLCRHTYDYVMRVLTAADQVDFDRDVRHVREKIKRKQGKK